MKSLTPLLAFVTLLGAAPVPNATEVPPPVRILSVSMSQSSARPGDYVRGQVTTTKSTASIEVRIGGYGMSLQKVNITTFEGGFRIPSLPFFLRHRTWTVRVIARSITGGFGDERDLPLTIR